MNLIEARLTLFLPVKFLSESRQVTEVKWVQAIDVDISLKGKM